MQPMPDLLRAGKRVLTPFHRCPARRIGSLRRLEIGSTGRVSIKPNRRSRAAQISGAPPACFFRSRNLRTGTIVKGRRAPALVIGPPAALQWHSPWPIIDRTLPDVRHAKPTNRR